MVIHLLLASGAVGNASVQTVLHSSPLKPGPNSSSSSLPDGIYPDYSQACRMFFVISKGERKTFWCTKGFVFSETLGRCEPPDRTACTESRSPDHFISPCPIENGVYPDYSSGCSSFFICKGGRRTTVPCPAHTLFDWKTKSCRPSQDVLCNPLTCSDRKDGFYADAESGCRRYVECRLNYTTEHICPEGTIFNERTIRCSPAERTRCPTTDYTQCLGVPDGYYPDYRTQCKSFGLCLNGKLKTFNCPSLTVFNPTSLTCEPSAKCSKPSSARCVNMTNGIHPDFDAECKDFFVCVDGVATHFGSCPQGKILNPVTGTCQPKTLVVCSPVKDPDCDGYQDGIYPDYGTGCSAYYTCLGQRRISTSYCVGHDLFDISTGRCLPSSFVLCRQPSEMSFIARSLDSYRCEGRIGIFPDFASRCKHYIVCAYGYQKWHSCPEGKWFDPELETCSSKEPESCGAPSVAATFQCLPADEGIYGSSKCTQWHECWKGVGFSISCPIGQIYDSFKGRCITGTCSGIAKHFQIQSSAFGHVQELTSRHYDCSTKEDGVHMDENCRVFHLCAQGTALSFSCPKNFVFERQSNSCVSGPLKSSQCHLEEEEMPTATFSCSGHEDGMYSDISTDCRRYYVCEAGKTVTVYCPERHKFSSVKMVCDDEAKVTCSLASELGRNITHKKEIKNSQDTSHEKNASEVVYKDERDHVDHLVTSGEAKSFFTYYELKDDKEDSTFRGNRTFSPNLIPNIFTSKRQHSFKYIPTHTATEEYLKPNESNSMEQSPKETHPVTSSGGFTSLEPVESVVSENLNQSSICPSGDTGFYADYDSGCKKFHICFRTIRKTYSCPSFLLFNPDSKNCDLPENVQCSKPEPLEDDIFDCNGRRNQYFADLSSGCRHYIGCLGHSPFRFACPVGKIFSSESGSCEPEASTQCEENSSNNSGPQRRPDGSSVLKHVHGIPERFFFDCEDKADGFYPDYVRHCHVFYRCVRGKKFSHYCKQGMLFNPVSGICDFEENVICSSSNGTQAVPIHL